MVKLYTWIQDSCRIMRSFFYLQQQGLFLLCELSFSPGALRSSDWCPITAPSLALPRCKKLWSPSPGTTCWRWDWAELLLFAPLAPGFHKSLFLTLKEWCGLQMQSGQAEASIGIYGEVIYTWKRGEGLRSYLSNAWVHTHLQKNSSFLKGKNWVAHYFVNAAILNINLIKQKCKCFCHIHAFEYIFLKNPNNAKI